MIDQAQSGLNDNEIWDAFECYLNLPDNDNPEQNPLNYDHICEQQQADRKLLDLHRRYPQNYIYKSLTDDVKDIL